MATKEVKTTNAPQAIGPYSQAINHNGLCFLSGQIPLDTSGNLVKGGLRDQAEQVFKNIEAILIEQDATLKNIIKLIVYLLDINNFDVINGLMAELFEPPVLNINAYSPFLVGRTFSPLFNEYSIASFNSPVTSETKCRRPG